MSPPPADTAELLHTRWMFLIPNEQYVSIDSTCLSGQSTSRRHHVEVVAVHGDRATVVTCYSYPLLSWEVPTACFFVAPGAFRYLGTAEEFAWVRPGSSTRTTETWAEANPGATDAFAEAHPGATPWEGVWIIDALLEENVHFAPRPIVPDGADVAALGNNTPWEQLLRLYREATPQEIQAFHRYLLDFEQVWRRIERLRPPAPPPPEPVFDGPRPTRWEHLGRDEE